MNSNIFSYIFGKYYFNFINYSIYIFCKHYLIRKDIEITPALEGYEKKKKKRERSRESHSQNKDIKPLIMSN